MTDNQKFGFTEDEIIYSFEFKITSGEKRTAGDYCCSELIALVNYPPNGIFLDFHRRDEN